MYEPPRGIASPGNLKIVFLKTYFLGFKRYLKQNQCLKLVKYFASFSDLGFFLGGGG